MKYKPTNGGNFPGGQRVNLINLIIWLNITSSNLLFVAFPWVVTSTGSVGFMVVCVFYAGTPEGSTESGFMEKPESNLRPLVYKT